VATCSDALACRTHAARVAILSFRTVDGLRQGDGDRPLSHTLGSGEQQALRHPPSTHGLAQQLDDRPMAHDRGERHDRDVT
jgi:hypothetical protein